MEDGEINSLYAELKSKWESHLKSLGVILPNLKSNGSYTKDALVLIYLYKKIGKKVSKEELTNFIKNYYPNTNDVQQARHLGAQKGWFIISGTRGDIEARKNEVGNGEYMLVNLSESYPNFTHSRREYSKDNDAAWEEIKSQYNFRCACCGSKEGEPNIHYPGTTTKLQKGHKDPSKPLNVENMIPQCEKCNRPDRNYFVFDKKGRVTKIADPKFILKSSEIVQKEAFEILKNKFSK